MSRADYEHYLRNGQEAITDEEVFKMSVAELANLIRVLAGELGEMENSDPKTKVTRILATLRRKDQT